MMTRGVVEATGVVSLLQMVLAVDVVRVLQVRGQLRLFKSGDVVDGEVDGGGVPVLVGDPGLRGADPSHLQWGHSVTDKTWVWHSWYN